MKNTRKIASDFLEALLESLPIIVGVGTIVAVGVPVILSMIKENKVVNAEKGALNNFENIVLKDIADKDGNIKKVDIRGVDVLKGSEQGLVTLQGMATYDLGDQKFVKLNYEINNQIINNLSTNFKDGNVTDFIKELANVIEKETLKDLVVTETNIDNELFNSIIYHNNEKKAYDIDGNNIYYGYENAKDFRINQNEWLKQADKRTESTLIYVGTPVVDEENKTIYFETEVLIQQFKLEHVTDGGTNRYKELSVIKKTQYTWNLPMN